MMESMYNLNIERALLSSLLFDTFSSESEYLLFYLTSDDFYLPFHQRFFSACQTLHKEEKPIEEEFIRIILTKENAWNEVAMLDVMSAPSISNTKAYISQIRELSQKRSLSMVSHYIKKQITEEGTPPQEVIESTIKKIEAIAENGSVRVARKSMAYTKASESEFLCKSWIPIPKATTSMIVAPGGTGKTFFILQLAVRIAREDASLRIFLWLSEDPEWIVKDRYDAVCKEIIYGQKGTEDVQIDICTEAPTLLLESHGKTATLSSQFYTLKRELREYDVIVIDPLLAFFGGDENDNSQARVFMQPFLNWARSENKSIIFLHHSRKGEGNNQSRARGAGAIVDAVRCVYDMDKVYIKKSGEQQLDPLSTHMRKITLTKDNYGAIKHLGSFSVEREITPHKSAPYFETAYEESNHFTMPVIQ